MADTPGHQERFFAPHQHETVEAAMARIIPSDDGTPGAREAGVVEFVDRYLSGVASIHAMPDGSGFKPLSGKVADAWRRRIGRLREQYAEGIEDLDRRSREGFGRAFVELDPDDQDELLRALERAGTAIEAGLQEPATETGLEFFELLVLHARQGFYADPIYGGNREQVGWRHIGFRGPASLAEVHSGGYTTLPYFAAGDASSS